MVKTHNGLSVYEAFKIVGVVRILGAGSLLTIRNVLGQIQIHYSEVEFGIKLNEALYIDLFVFRLVMIIGMIFVGYICMTKMMGRKILLLYILLAITIIFDSISMIVNFTMMNSSYDFDLIIVIIMKCQQIMTSLMMFFIIQGT